MGTEKPYYVEKAKRELQIVLRALSFNRGEENVIEDIRHHVQAALDALNDK